MTITEVKELKRKDDLGNNLYQVSLSDGNVCYFVGSMPPPVGVNAGWVAEKSANGKVWKRLVMFPSVGEEGLDIIAASIARDVPEEGLDEFIRRYKKVKALLG